MSAGKALSTLTLNNKAVGDTVNRLRNYLEDASLRNEKSDLEAKYELYNTKSTITAFAAILAEYQANLVQLESIFCKGDLEQSRILSKSCFQLESTADRSSKAKFCSKASPPKTSNLNTSKTESPASPGTSKKYCSSYNISEKSNSSAKSSQRTSKSSSKTSQSKLSNHHETKVPSPPISKSHPLLNDKSRRIKKSDKTPRSRRVPGKHGNTNGLLPSIEKIWSIAVRNLDGMQQCLSGSGCNKASQILSNASLKPSNTSRQSSNASLKISNVSQKLSNFSQKTSYTSQKRSNVSEKLCNASAKSSQTSQKLSHASQKLGTTSHKSSIASEMASNISQLFNNSAEESSYVSERSSNSSHSWSNTSQDSSSNHSTTKSSYTSLSVSSSNISSTYTSDGEPITVQDKVLSTFSPMYKFKETVPESIERRRIWNNAFADYKPDMHVTPKRAITNIFYNNNCREGLALDHPPTHVATPMPKRRIPDPYFYDTPLRQLGAGTLIETDLASVPKRPKLYEMTLNTAKNISIILNSRPSPTYPC